MSNKPSFKQAQIEFAAHIRDPELNPKPDSIEDRRMAIYRDLFINSIAGLLSGSFPVIRSLYNDKDWQQLVRAYYKKEHNKTPHFPEIPREFVAFLKDHQQIDPRKPFLYELAHYEWLELHLEKHSIEIEKYTDENAAGHLLHEVPVVSPLVRLHTYQHPVHQIKTSFQPQEQLEQPLFMAVWRDTEYQVHFTAMNPFSALLLENLMNHSELTGQQLLEQLAEAHQYPDKKQFVQFGLQTLKKWLDQDIIIPAKNNKIIKE
ncbi:FIG005107: hypothetical protein [hydrothermal vent metagenome]|uniref:Uncharacterized protein n=1 Tax=hydrothermal vent metagenome TaxID=652676 RepID=A0A3B0WGB0_9ZZZZ